MIRTGYLRWEIEATDSKSAQDRLAREVRFFARPTYRFVRIKDDRREQAAERFLTGEASYDVVLSALKRSGDEVDVRIPDVGPSVFRYSESDRTETPRFWMTKLERSAHAFACDIVRVASGFPKLVIASEALRAGYAQLVRTEIFRVIEGRSVAAATDETTPMRIEADNYASGVPELVAAELVRDVVEKREFEEFCSYDRVTVYNGGKYYRIPRRPHALIEVWDAKTFQPEARICVVFQDAGMPPSDELVMKYLLAKHQPDMLWKIGTKYGPPPGKFDAPGPKRWTQE